MHYTQVLNEKLEASAKHPEALTAPLFRQANQ